MNFGTVNQSTTGKTYQKISTELAKDAAYKSVWLEGYGQNG